MSTIGSGIDDPGSGLTKRAEVSHLRRRCARLEAAMCMISGCADLDELLDSLLGPDHEHEGEANG